MTQNHISFKEEQELLMQQVSTATPSPRLSEDHESITSASTTSLVLENLNAAPMLSLDKRKPMHNLEYREDVDLDDPEIPRFLQSRVLSMSKKLKRIIWVLGVIGLLGWIFALVVFVAGGRYKHASQLPYDHETPSTSSGRKITLDEVQSGQWLPQHHEISWIEGPSGEDGLLLERGVPGKAYLIVEDIRSRTNGDNAMESRVLMSGNGWFEVDGQKVWPDEVWPSPDLKKVLVMSRKEKNWRHSSTGNFWIFDVETQQAQPLDPGNSDRRIQLASWAPTSDSVVFTRDNNMFLRIIGSDAVRQITSDGGQELFYGVPDWVYEEEVFSGNSATWWARDGQYIAFLRTNETEVPEYPVQYFISRPSGKRPKPGEENYPEVREIKYPKAGAPNPTVDLQFYDVARAEVFSVNIEGGFVDDDRLIIEVLWAEKSQVLIRETNRESDIIRLVLVDVNLRTGKVVRIQDIAALDGGWVEPTQSTRFVPADPANSRPHDGYIDTIIHENNDHLAYFTPLDNPNPIMLTSGDWEVVRAPSALDLKNNLVYFSSTKQAPTQRHIYSVRLDGTDLIPIVPTDKPSYYTASFSKGAGYALITYNGPGIPSQKIISTPSNPTDAYNEIVESNNALSAFAAKHEMPQLIYSTVIVENFTLQVVERRPPHFNPNRKYPVLFYLYGGPGSQTVSLQFLVDFQSYMASAHNIVVVTVDGRGTGFIGRKARCIIRGQVGQYEAHDQIETAKIWAAKPYIDSDKIAIWGWSYGGFMTLKTLEVDAGQTFKYGMAVAPVTDWRFYDSIYTERYMHTPQNNPTGYDSSSIHNVSALSKNVRWLMMHGVADDNVHMQSTLTLIDKLDLARIENYDLMMFPDSDHSIWFHNANRVVYDKLDGWVRGAFQGIWDKVASIRGGENDDELD